MEIMMQLSYVHSPTAAEQNMVYLYNHTTCEMRIYPFDINIFILSSYENAVNLLQHRLEFAQHNHRSTDPNLVGYTLMFRLGLIESIPVNDSLSRLVAHRLTVEGRSALATLRLGRVWSSRASLKESLRLTSEFYETVMATAQQPIYLNCTTPRYDHGLRAIANYDSTYEITLGISDIEEFVDNDIAKQMPGYRDFVNYLLLEKLSR